MPSDQEKGPREVACPGGKNCLSKMAVTASTCTAGMACSMMLADLVYDVPASVILESAQRAVTGWDLITSMIKSWVFGTIISVVPPPPFDPLFLKQPHPNHGRSNWVSLIEVWGPIRLHVFANDDSKPWRNCEWCVYQCAWASLNSHTCLFMTCPVDHKRLTCLH